MATNDEQIREMVKESYGQVAVSEVGQGCCGPSGGCGERAVDDYAKTLGYSAAELAEIPEDANLGLGCGNPMAIAGLSEGEVVLDLGSGAGMDAFLAASKVTETGRVIGVDMTPQMLKRARETAAARGVSGFVEFREGLIEALPVVSESVDVVISNCVINLSPDKLATFREAHRVLKPGGRLAISDICLSEALPPEVASLAEAYVGCVAGASLADDYLGALEAAGFTEVEWTRTSADAMWDGIESVPGLVEGIGVDTGQLEAVRGMVWSYRVSARRSAS